LPKKDIEEWGEGTKEISLLNKSFTDSKSKTKLDHDDYKAVKERLELLAQSQTE
jgi:hypothetical protein